MFEEASEEAGELARATAVRVCWSQWASLGSLAVSNVRHARTSVVDPEALVLLSLAVRAYERRLGDLVGWWAETSAHLVSVQRMRTLAKLLPADVGQACLAEFAALAVDAGDRRWRRHAGEAPVEWVRSGRPSPVPDLLAPAALWPRLRAGLGVGAKADVLVFLLGRRSSASVPEIASAVHYSKVAVRNAAGDMATARLLRETDRRPAEYLAPDRPWAELLELTPSSVDGTPDLNGRELPRWHHWADLFAFLAGVSHWSDRGVDAQGRDQHTWASRARDLVDGHARVLSIVGVEAPPMERFRGRDAAVGLLETTRALAEWAGGVE